MSLIGKEVIEFKANAFHNGEFIEVTNEDFKGHWSVVCFYPADFTFVCPTELEDLQEQYATLKSLGVEVYSVSTDTHFTHKAWHDHSEAISKLEYKSSKKLSVSSAFLGSELLATTIAPLFEISVMKLPSSICSLSENPLSEYEVKAAVWESGL